MDDNISKLTKSIDKLNETVSNFYQYQSERKGSNSDLDDYGLSSISRSRNLDANQKKFLQRQYENYERSNRSFWSNFRNQRTWSGFFRSYIEKSQERFAKNAIARQLGPAATRGEINNIYKSMPYAVRGRGFTAGVFTALTKFAQRISGVIFALQILSDALKATAEARKFYVPSIRQGYGFDQLGSMFANATRTINLTRNPLISGLYANNPDFKNSLSEVMSAGILGQNGIRDTEALIRSFKFVASQGIILGDTFNETAKNIISTASIYDLSFAGNNIEGYKYINKFVERGILEGYGKVNIQGIISNYAKSVAVSTNGFAKLGEDLRIMFDTIYSINKDKNQMPYFASIFQNLMSSRLSNLSTFAALVDGGSSYSVAGLGSLATLFQGSSPLVQKTVALRNLLRKSGMGTSKDEIALITELYPEFSAFRDEKSVSALQALVQNPNIDRRLLKDTQNLNAKELAEYAERTAGISEKQKIAIERTAQATEAMSNPLETLKTIAIGMLNILYSIAMSPVMKLVASDIRIGSADQYIEGVKTRTGNALNQIRQRS